MLHIGMGAAFGPPPSPRPYPKEKRLLQETEVPYITKFQSGRRARSIKYVVRPSRTTMDQATGFVTNSKPLRAEFKEHSFDIEMAAKVYDWSDEECRHVSEYLQRHNDWGRVDGRGIFEDKRATVVPVSLSEQELQQTATDRGLILQRRCAFGEVVAGEYLQCEEPPSDEEHQFCEAHGQFESK